MNPFATTTAIRSKGSELKRGAICAALFILSFAKPLQINEELRRREIVLNAILFIILSLLFIESLLVIIPSYTQVHYEGVSILFIGIVDFIFLFLLFLSRRGFIAASSYILIFVYFILASYGAYRWGVDLPSSLLSYALLAVISSILIGTRFGFIVSILIGSTILSLGILENEGLYAPHRTWQLSKFLIDDAFEYACIIIVITSISWLSNRETESALRRARQSEKTLREERDSLEVTVAERTKKLKQAQLEKVSELYRFVEFGKLASGLFHDLMSPLTSLSLSIDNLYKQGLLADTALSKEIDIAIKSSTRMANFIKGVKKKIQKSDAEVLFNIYEELNQVIEFLSSKWKPAGISIHTDIPHGLSIRGNPIMFHHIFTNLISNAIDAFEGTKIVDKAVNVIVIEKEEDIKITISDNGKGIPFEIISQIFEPFFTTKSHNGGSGIGLPATRHALQKYFNGSITVESVESKGSAFTAYITKKPHDRSVNGSED